MDMLYKYKEAFSWRDEIGTWPNIEVGIDVTDKYPFFIRPYHVKEEDREGNKAFMLFRNIKGRIFAIFKPGNVNQSKINTGQKSSNGV